MADTENKWRGQQIRNRLEQVAQEAGASVVQFASLKIRPMQPGPGRRPEQSYLDGHHYSEIRRRIDARLDHKGRRKRGPVRFEEHESGPELIIDLAQLGLETITTILAVIASVVALLDRKKERPQSPPPRADQVSISLRHVDGDKLKEVEITVIAQGQGADQATKQATKVIAALEKAATKRSRRL